MGRLGRPREASSAAVSPHSATCCTNPNKTSQFTPESQVAPSNIHTSSSACCQGDASFLTSALLVVLGSGSNESHSIDSQHCTGLWSKRKNARFDELYMVMEICDSDLKKLCRTDLPCCTDEAAGFFAGEFLCTFPLQALACEDSALKHKPCPSSSRM